jgi:hypothetical protein
LFSNYKPQLTFSVVKGKQGLQLKTEVNINGANFHLGDFERFHFLLCSRTNTSCWHSVISRRWNGWQQQIFAAFSRDPAAFAQNILARLEENYQVNRNGLFSQQMIEVAPYTKGAA